MKILKDPWKIFTSLATLPGGSANTRTYFIIMHVMKTQDKHWPEGLLGSDTDVTFTSYE